jgi:ERCC4-type nuclease
MRGEMDKTTVTSIGNVVRKRRLLLIATQSLFGTGIISLIEEQKEQLVIEKVPEAKMALEICGTFKPDVVVDFRETSSPEDQALIQELVSRYHARVVHCTLEANQLTIYDKTRIINATVEDLMSAVLK